MSSIDISDSITIAESLSADTSPSFESEANKPNSRKIVLVEIDLGKTYTKWTNESAGVWKTRLYFQETDAEYGFKQSFLLSPFKQSGTATVSNADFPGRVKVGSLQEDGVELTEAVSLAAVVATAARWYFNYFEQMLYVQLTNSDWVHEHAMTIGVEARYTNDSLASDLGQGYYEERLLDVGGITKSKDSHKYGFIQGSASSIRLDNLDGALDSFLTLDVYGQQCRIKYGFEGLLYEQYKEIVRTYVESISLDPESVSLHLRDDRKRLSRMLPLYEYDQTTYTDLNDKDVGKPIPLPFGTCYRVPCVCTNEDESSPSNYTFKVADLTDYTNQGIQIVSAVYVDGVSVAWVGRNALTGMFTIADANYDPGQTVTADIVGIGTRNLCRYGECEDGIKPSFLDQTADGDLNCTTTLTTEQAYAGTTSLKHTLTAGGGVYQLADEDNRLTDYFEGKTITASAWVYVPSMGGPALNEVHIRLIDDGGNNDSGNPTAFDTWERLTVTRTYGTGLTYARINLRMANTASASEYVYWDNIQIELADEETDFIPREEYNYPLSLIEHLLSQYLSITYGSTNYDTTEWAAAKANALHNQIGLFLAERTQIVDIIEKLVDSMGANFIRKNDGLYTCRITDVTATGSRTLYEDEVAEAPSVSPDMDELLTSVSIGYARTWGDKKFRWYTYDDEEAALYARYSKYQRLEKETLLINSTDAQELAEHLAEIFNDAEPIVTHTTFARFMDVEIMDVLHIPVRRQGGGVIYADINAELIDFDKDAADGTVTMELRRLNDA
jgi:hypothetical protein